MKKKICFLILFIIFTGFMLLYKKNVSGVTSTVDPLHTYGFKITVLSYDGTNPPEQLGKPILVYREGLLDSVSRVIKGNYPTGSNAYNQLLTQNWNLAQIIPKNVPEGTTLEEIRIDPDGTDTLTGDDKLEASNPNNGQNNFNLKAQEQYEAGTSVTKSIKNLIKGLADYNSGGYDKARDTLTNAMYAAFGSETTDSFSQDFLGDMAEAFAIEEDEELKKGMIKSAIDTAYLLNSKVEVNSELQRNIQLQDGKEYNRYEYKVVPGTCPYRVSTGGNGEMPTDEVIRRYMSDERKMTFPTELIDLSEYNNVYQDEGTASEIVAKYAGSLDKIEEHFGVSISAQDMKKIYFQVEVVQRVLDTNPENQIVVGSNIVSVISKLEVEPQKWTSDVSKDPWHPVKVCGGGCTAESDTTTSSYGQVASALASDMGCHKVVEKTASKTEYEWVEGANAECQKGWKKTGNSTVEEGKVKLECKHTITWTYTEKDYDSCKDNMVTLYSVYPCNHGQRRIYYISGIISIAPSKIVTVRNYTGELEANFADRAKNSCETGANRHCLEDISGFCKTPRVNLYYVGPNLEKALVGPASVDPKNTAIKDRNYLFSLGDAKWEGSQYTCNKENGNLDLGIQHFYSLGILECEENCLKASSDRSSDTYLKCAEQYAEHKVDTDTQATGENARKKKWNYILNICSYTYGVSPTSSYEDKTNNNRESRDSCNNSSSGHSFVSTIAYNYIIQAKVADLNSKCNIVDGVYDPQKKVSEMTGVRVSSCTGDNVTDFDGRDSNDTPFDQRTYINKICKDTTSFEFKDTSNEVIKPGTGFTYPVVQEGARECTYFFNKEQWKVDYASAPARDPDARKRLLYILEKFKKESYNGEMGPSGLSTEDDLDLYGLLKFQQEKFDYSETNVSAKVEEYVTTKKNPDNKNLTLQIESVEHIGPILSVSNSTETVVKIENGSISSPISLNRYVSRDNVKVTRSLKKVCVSSDGLATVSDAPENGVCEQRKVNGKTVDVKAERKYYTSFQIDINKNSKVKTTVSVGNNNYYYKDNESCTYTPTDDPIPPPPEEYEWCKLLISSGEHGPDGITYIGDVEVSIRYNIPKSLINYVSITDNDKETISENITVKNNNKAVQEHKLLGKVYLNDGSNVQCPKPITIEANVCSNVSCKIVKSTDPLVYEVQSTGSVPAANYYWYTSLNLDKTKIVADSSSGKRYIRLGQSLQDGEVLKAYVTDSSNACENYCVYKGPIQIEKPNCLKDADLDLTNLTDVSEYCKLHAWDDENDFKGDTVKCVNICSKCPNDCNNKTEVEKHCANAKLLYEEGTMSSDLAKSLCMQTCYCDTPKTVEKDYLFRSVNVYNPFPNSQESVLPYEKGNRLIGKNWQFLSEIITKDSSDSTSVTGDNANKAVEYVIDISPADLQEIRKDTKESSLNVSYNKRRVYGKLDRVTTSSKKVIEKYKSKFINETYASLFKQSHGNIPASFSPGSN